MLDRHVFSVDRIQSLRRAIARATRFPDNGSDGWRKSPVDPCLVLNVFRLLHLLPGCTLRAYQFRLGGNGNAFVYAMPVNSPFPEPDECPRDEFRFLEPPVPSGALSDVMAAITGDGSPESYMQASIFAREIVEFGALWHGSEWSMHEIIAANSRCLAAERQAEWEWMEFAPVEWSPTVTMGDQIVSEFYSYTILGGERLTRHVHSFQNGSYVCVASDRMIAKGPDCVVF